jgi:hypothetical protein
LRTPTAHDQLEHLDVLGDRRKSRVERLREVVAFAAPSAGLARIARRAVFANAAKVTSSRSSSVTSVM